MDVESEVSRMAGVTEGQNDDELDKLLRKAVTVSQVNLPIATIDKDIDDIANSYAEENQHPDKTLDKDFVRLLERTRQRRELLDQKKGKHPEAAPRKRRSPLSEDLTDNVGGRSAESEDSPKRQCVRGSEQEIKPDTPAIAGVRSRLQQLATQRACWAEESENQETVPVPSPRKSVSSPPVNRTKAVSPEAQENAQPSSQRKSRFAELASNISSWEDDLSHPTIIKEEEKKAQWQPPKASSGPNPDTVNSSTAAASTSGRQQSPKKTAHAAPSQTKASLTDAAPSKTKTSLTASSTKSAEGLTHVSSSKASQQKSEEETKTSAVASSAATEPGAEKEWPQNEESSLNQKLDTADKSDRSRGEEGLKAVEEAAKDLTVTKAAGRQKASKAEGPMAMKGPETPRAVVLPPSDRPLSARLANWEQKISENTKPDVVATPKGGVSTPAKMSKTPKVFTPAQCVSTPARQDAEAVQLRTKTRRTAEDEPTAHPVSARMSAWEQMSSAQVVGSVKKVKPGDCTPIKTPGAKPPPARKSPTQTSAASTPGKTATQDGIKERAAQFDSSSDRHKPDCSTPGQACKMSPKKVGSAMKSAQEQLGQQTKSTETAQRLRQERMAELQTIQNRWKNGILQDDPKGKPQEPPKEESSAKTDRRRDVREKAREDFHKRLNAVGLDGAGVGPNKDNGKTVNDCDVSTDNNSSAPGPNPSAPSHCEAARKATRPTTLFTIVSQHKAETAAAPPKPGPAAGPSKACRKVKFEDSFEDQHPGSSPPKKQAPQVNTEATCASEAFQTQAPVDEEEKELVVGSSNQGDPPPQLRPDEDDDLSLSAFVPASVRRESILPSPGVKGGQDLDTSINSIDSFEGAPGAPPDFHKSTVDLVKLGQQYADSDSCSSLTSQATAHSPSQPQQCADSHSCSSQATAHSSPQPQSQSQDMEESVDDRDAIGDLLDEAMESDTEEASTSAKPPVPVMRRKANERKATTAGDLPFSVNDYRASRNMQIQEVKRTIVRNSQYAGLDVKEEDVQMPTAAPVPAPRRSLQDRIKELQELVQQEQNIIMQTSNALNQCCSSSFAGSSEQVECNRILLLSCQRRQVYMLEIQRLKDTRILDPDGPGPKGSLTISDIRLPLKKEFVTQMGTSQDSMTYYFILLLRNGTQLIFTQMLSTHDPMMRGSLDFPNLIKISNISGSFQLQLDIYCMSVSRETTGKDKKRKTPKKIKGSALTVQSPGGPMAVRTTCFTQVSSVLLSMRSVDKHCFSLDRLSHLSPLHGMLYMNLKCVMEASVEEKGFLTMFEDVSGFGSWHRRWCVLSGNKLQYWKYPDDESRKDPIGYIDLKRCTTEKVGLISRDICARPHTFELATVRQPHRGEKDTLVSTTHSTLTTVRHMLSADTKEERIVWCNKVNRALATLRTWHADAMRPVSQ